MRSKQDTHGPYRDSYSADDFCAFCDRSTIMPYTEESSVAVSVPCRYYPPVPLHTQYPTEINRTLQKNLTVIISLPAFRD